MKKSIFILDICIFGLSITALLIAFFKNLSNVNFLIGAGLISLMGVAQTRMAVITNLSKDNPRLGLHEFKKKFGGDYIEFMGEFDYVLKPLYYFAFTKLVPIYRNYIKKRKKKELKDEVRNINN